MIAVSRYGSASSEAFAAASAFFSLAWPVRQALGLRAIDHDRRDILERVALLGDPLRVRKGEEDESEKEQTKDLTALSQPAASDGEAANPTALPIAPEGSTRAERDRR